MEIGAELATLPLQHVFHPGETAPLSGVYQVFHGEHREPHRVLILQGDEFPCCRNCHRQVQFVLADEVGYAAHDWDFAGPNLRLVD